MKGAKNRRLIMSRIALARNRRPFAAGTGGHYN
jgi:hypothetical protein